MAVSHLRSGSQRNVEKHENIQPENINKAWQ